MRHDKQHRPTNMTAGLFLALLLATSAVHQSAATLFFIGSACVVGLNTAESMMGGAISERGLLAPMDQVKSLCRFMQRYSLEGVVLEDVLPLVRRLISLTARSSASFRFECNLDEFEDIVRSLAQVSVQITGG